MDKATADVFKNSDLYKAGNYTDPKLAPYLNLDYNCISGITDFKGISHYNCENCSNCGSCKPTEKGITSISIQDSSLIIKYT